MNTAFSLRRLAAHAFTAAVLLSLMGCGGTRSSTSGDADLALIHQVMDKVKASYVEPVSDAQLTKDSLKGMLTGLDPHSDYMDESEYEEMLSDSHGEFTGIGAELTRDDSHPKILSPIDDTPSALAGIKAGDVILRINGEATDAMSLKDAVDKLRGPAGTKVRITILRNGQKPFDVTLTRAVIRIASVKSHLESGRIGYVRVTTFMEKTQSELVDAIDRLKREAGGRLDGLVLDLRNDPGGLLDSAVSVAGDFLDGGTIVSIHGRSPGEDETFDARPNGDRLHGVPVVVLINSASASASEIVAGALQDRRRATILGTRSFGKGSVQTIIPLDGHGALRLTTARYYTPSGRSIQGEGITPDQVVLPPKDEQVVDAMAVHENDLHGALKNTGPAAPTDKGAARAPAGQQDADDVAIDPTVIGTAKDYQLAVAVMRLKEMVARGAPAGRS
ncbi:MAG TPA: S41 family peptidase [Stellaceae bacterium]|nr:S41 family peptidase [Stellaceae bacterium]